MIPKIIVKIFETNNADRIKKLLSKLPSNIIELLIENSILSQQKNIRKNVTQRDILLDIYKSYYNEYTEANNNKFWICSYLYYDTNILRCLKDIEKGWVNCTNNEIEFFNKQKKEKETVIKTEETNIYGYYGKFNNDKFCIAETDKKAMKNYKGTNDGRLLKPGVQCGTGDFKKPGLLKLVINIFKLPIPSSDRKDIQNNIKYWNEIKDDKINKLKYVKDSRYVNDIFEEDQRENIDDIEPSEINRIYYWMKQTTDVKCKLLREFLYNNKLLIEDPNCGTQRKKKVEEKTNDEKKKNKEKQKK
jgi:hypothetical protein